MKLLVMSIVANVRSQSSRNFCMFLSHVVFSKLISAMSAGDRLKKAISEPLANADAPISSMVSNMVRTTPNVGATK